MQEKDPLHLRTTTRQPPHHFAFVDALRGYAILAVLMIHCGLTVSSLPPFVRKVTGAGGFGVQLFFVISAFTLFWTMRSRETVDRHPVKAFFIRRLFRIAPLFWIAIVFYLLHPSKWRADFAPNGIGTGHVVSTMLFVHGWYPTTINSVVPGGWSMGAEAMFYLCIPFLYKTVRSLRRAIAMTLVSTFAVLAYSRFLQSVLSGFFPQTLLDDFLFWSFPAQLPVFCLGMVLYFVIIEHMHGSPPEHASKKKPGLLLLGMSMMIMLTDVPAQVQYALAFVLLAWGLAIQPIRIAVNPPIRFIGMVSYSIYIWHVAILELVAPRLLKIVHVSSRVGVNGFVQLLCVYACVCLLSVVVASASYYVIEAPSRRAGSWIIRKSGWGPA